MQGVSWEVYAAWPDGPDGYVLPACRVTGGLPDASMFRDLLPLELLCTLSEKEMMDSFSFVV